MHKVSKLYRSDDHRGLEADIRKYLDEHYIRELENIDRPNPKLLVVFSGGNALGKTTISQEISKRIGGLVLENDHIKRHLLEFMPDMPRDELNKKTWQYSMELYDRLDKLTSNGLIVRDGIIDWYFDRILPIFENAGYTLFIVSFELSEAKLRELIKNRGDTPTVKEERLYQLLDEHKIHTKNFRDKYKADVILNDNNIFDHELVLKKLELKMKEIKT